MNPSVSPEADRELTEGAVYYTREAGAELGLAFIAEFERALALICARQAEGLGQMGARTFSGRTASDVRVEAPA